MNTINITIPDELYEDLKIMAKEQGYESVESLVHVLVASEIDKFMFLYGED